jgi:serine/threonine protein kinase
MYSFKSDVWAIGVIYFEMLTGKTPWRAKTESDLKRQIKSNPIKALLPSNISSQSVEFLKKSLEPNPVLRMSP